MGVQEKHRKKYAQSRSQTSGHPTGVRGLAAENEPLAPLVPHTPRCPCAACEQQRKEALRRAIGVQYERRRTYVPGHADPEHRAGWAAAEDRLAEYIVLHLVEMDERLHVTSLDLKPQLVAHLDGLLDVGERDLDAGLLHEALLVVEHMKDPAGRRGRLVRARAIERLSGVQMAQREHMSEAAISRNLDAGLDLVLQVYGGLALAEQQRAAG